MSTVVTSSSAYATAQDLINAHDAGQIGNWATDTKVALTPTQILSDPIVAAALLRASGEVEQACFVGERYTPTDLAALTGASAAALKGMVCDLAFYHIGKRRVPEPEKIAGYKEAKQMLQDLRDGKLIFGFQDAADAARVSSIDMRSASTGNERRPTGGASRLFGQRMDDFAGDGARTWTPDS